MKIKKKVTSLLEHTSSKILCPILIDSCSLYTSYFSEGCLCMFFVSGYLNSSLTVFAEEMYHGVIYPCKGYARTIQDKITRKFYCLSKLDRMDTKMI